MPGLFDDDEPALRQITRAELIKAYAEELHQHPPFTGVAGDGPALDAKRLEYANKDITRMFKAAFNINCTIQLVPIAKEAKRP